jgi:hypothetical protein
MRLAVPAANRAAATSPGVPNVAATWPSSRAALVAASASPATSATSTRAPSNGARPRDVGQFDEQRHQLAVQVAGPVRGDLPSADRKHGLIEHRQPRVDLARTDHDDTLKNQAHRAQGGVAVPVADILHLLGQLDRPFGVAVLLGIHDVEIEQVTVLGTVGCVLQQPAGAADPARTNRWLATQGTPSQWRVLPPAGFGCPAREGGTPPPTASAIRRCDPATMPRLRTR